MPDRRKKPERVNVIAFEEDAGRVMTLLTNHKTGLRLGSPQWQAIDGLIQALINTTTEQLTSAMAVSARTDCEGTSMSKSIFALGIAAALSSCASPGTAYSDNAARLAAGTTSGVVEPGTGNYVPSGAVSGKITNSTNGTVRKRH